jgi:formylglycine-generating enzyme required for sulfatase activity
MENSSFLKQLIFPLLVALSWVSPVLGQEEKVPKGIWVSPSTQMQFIKIPAGCFIMGSDNGFAFEAPAHKVCIDSFYLGTYEVTQKQWSIFKAQNLSKFIGENHPVQRVSWNDAQDYLQRLNSAEKTDRYRLPSEAE